MDDPTPDRPPVPGVDPSLRFDLRGRTLRGHTARGTVVNAAFLVGVTSLGLLRGFVMAALLTRSDYGVWGLAIVTMSIVAGVQTVAIGDKYIQQDDPDQEVAFQRAFSLSLLLALASVAGGFLIVPVAGLVSGVTEMILPGLLVSLVFLAAPFQMPIHFHYRRMEFVRQRVLQSIDPIVSFVVMVGLALAGAGYWSFFIGVLVGACTTSLVAMRRSPYRFKWRYDRGTLRSYWSFSGPLVLANFSGLLLAVLATFGTELIVGLAGAGAVTLAATVSQFTSKVDALVTGTLYPALVAVRDRLDTLYESFVKSNRLALMWAMPLGIGLSLFCRDLVIFGLGDRWLAAVPLLEAFGVVAALGHVGFNWDAYFRALGDTRPVAVAAVASALTFLAVGMPLLYFYGLRGLAIGVAAQTFVHVAFRAFYLSRLFHGFQFLRHAARAIVPSLPAVALVLAFRAVESGERTLGFALGEIAVYLLTTIVATWAIEGRLLREVADYLRAPAPRAS